MEYLPMNIDWTAIKLFLLKYTSYLINAIIVCVVLYFIGWYLWALVQSAAS